MDRSVYTRPNKAFTGIVQRRLTAEETEQPLLSQSLPQPLVVAAGTECHITPDPIAERMVDYLLIEDNLSYLEPSSGTGSLINALINEGIHPGAINSVEKFYELHEAVNIRFGLKHHYHQCFLDYAAQTHHRFDRIIMNPPFRQTKKHIQAALRLLNPAADRTVMVALVPCTFEHPEAEFCESLNNDTFASTKVNTKIIRFMQ